MTILRNLSLKQQGIGFVALLLILELSFISVIASNLIASEEASKREAAAKDIAIDLNQVIFYLFTMEHHAFKLVGTGQAQFREGFWKVFPLMASSMATMQEAAKNFPEIVPRVNVVAECLKVSCEIEREMVLDHMKGHYSAASGIRSGKRRDIAGRKLIAEIRDLQEIMQPIIKENSNLAKQSRGSFFTFMGIAVLANILLAIFFVIAYFKGITSRLGILSDNSQKMIDGLELNPPLKVQDEIGRLDAVFHKMAKDVREAARKQRALTENAQDVIFSMSSEGKFLKLNPAASRNWGYSNDELLEKSAVQLLSADEQERFKQSLQRLSESADIGGEYQLRLKDGQNADTVWSMHWSDYDNCFFSVVHDISERKRAERTLRASEARARTIVDSMLVGLLTVNEQGTIVSANPRTLQLLQYSLDEVLGKTLQAIFPLLQMEIGESAMSSFFQKHEGAGNENAVHINQLECRRRNGEMVHLELWFSELPSTSEKDNFLVNILDVSARHEIEKAKQEFIAIVRNDLRTPLSAVEGYLKNFSSGSKESLVGDGKNKSELAIGNIDGLLRLLDDLLEINNLESGQLALVCKQCSLVSVLQRSLEAVRGFAERHSVKLEYAEGGKIELFADPDRLGRVVINLLSNAIKFSPKDETVSLIVEESSNDVLLKIVDRGRGVPDSHKELIFERFKQVKSSDATQKGGSGLGLAICKAIVEQHGGQIGVDSIEGKGSTFWFQIPKTAVEQSSESVEKPIEEK